MNILEEIQNCPVEWKELGEVVDVLDSLRRPITKSQRIPGDIPYYGANGIQDYVKDWIFDGTFILMGEDGSVIKNDNSPILHWVVGKIWVNNHAHILGEVPGCALLKYVYYVLSQTDVSDIVRGTPPKLNQKNLKSIKIPIPPLEIQEKIVQILDKFTDYVTELTSELTSRKKQYSFYRDKLLSFEDEVYQVEWKTLGEVARFNYGYTDKAKETGDIRFIRITDIDENGYLKSNDKKYISLTEESRNYLVKHGDLLMARTGATYGKTLFIDTDETSAYASFLIKITPSEKLNSRYYWHFSKSELYWKQANNLVSKAGQPQFNANSLKNVKIPIPSLEIQSRIVQVLDNFDTVCNDLKIGLPKEIELRQKQYEYFREKLLTFVAEGEYTDSTVQYRQDIIRLLNWVFGPIRVNLGQVINLQRGKRLVRNQLTTSGSFPVYQNSLTPLGYFTHSNRPKETSFVICAGAAGEIGYSNLDFWAADDVYTLETSDNISDKFMYYVLISKQDRLKSQVRKASIPRLSKDAIDKVAFYLPSLSEQERIVSILDNFNTLTNSLSEGLPKEIELRQKQYEYWREQLLNFTRQTL